MKVAFAFFGISRSLKYTIDSIKTNVFSIFTLNNIEYDIFFHTYKLNNYTNVRTKEKTDNYDNEDYKLLNANYLKIDDQDEIKKQIDMTQYRTHKDPWNTNYNSVDNFILAQYSKSQVVRMIEATNIDYDYVIYIRPDCLYPYKFNIDFLKLVNDTTICIPDFHLSIKYSFNDRFCISNMKTYKFYGDTFEKLLKMSKTQSLHSETILGEIMHTNNIGNIRIPYKFCRIRCDGRNVDNF